MNDTYCLIPLSQGKFSRVSPEDYEFLSQFKWCANKGTKTYYAVRNRPKPGKGNIRMHREVARLAGLPYAKEYDHKDRDGLNNQRSNIRAATHTQNHANAAKRSNCSSAFKGVSWDKHSQQWQAYISISGKVVCLGGFASELEAALVYDAAARRHFGEFACVNFPEK